MSRVPMTQAVAADYADAMLVARRAKNLLFYLLALVLLIQLGIFFAARYVPNLKLHADVTAVDAQSGAVPTTISATPTDIRSAQEARIRRIWPSVVQYIIPATDFLGMILSMSLAVVLLILIMIMLVGRLVGVSHVTSAFCRSVVLIVLLFPWQTLVNSQARAMAGAVPATQPAEPADQAPDVKVPGVLYTYPELARDYDFPETGALPARVLKWSRFVAFPLIAMIMLLRIQGRSRRGLRFALGEAEMPVGKE